MLKWSWQIHRTAKKGKGVTGRSESSYTTWNDCIHSQHLASWKTWKVKALRFLTACLVGCGQRLWVAKTTSREAGEETNYLGLQDFHWSWDAMDHIQFHNKICGTRMLLTVFCSLKLVMLKLSSSLPVRFLSSKYSSADYISDHQCFCTQEYFFKNLSTDGDMCIGNVPEITHIFTIMLFITA